MKKFLTLSFAAVLLLSLTACGNKEEEKNENNMANSTVVTENKESTTTEKISETFIKIFSSGNYHMKSKITEDGTSITIETYKKGDMVATKIEDGNEYQQMVMRDSKLYLIDDTAKTIIATPARENDEYVDQTPETAGMSYITSGTADFDGKSLPYEEYSNTEGEKIQYFLNGNTLAGIRNINGEQISDVIILLLDQDVPANIFELPTEYQQIES